MAHFMLHALLTLLSQFSHDIKSWRHKLKKHILAIIPPFYGIGISVDRATAQQNVEKALNNGNFTFHSYDVTVSCFFPSLFHHLMEPLAASLQYTGASCNCAMLDYTFRLKELCPPLRIPHEDQRLKLGYLSVQTFMYALTMVSNQLCGLTCLNLSKLVHIKYILNQYKAGVLADPPQEFSHSEYANDWMQLYNMFN